MNVKAYFAAAALATALAGGTALAGTIPYADTGTVNSESYTFTASSTGDLVAYFAGSGASYDEQVGLLVNGVQVGPLGLDDKSSHVGDSIDFGHVNAGDKLVFFDDIISTGNTWYSQASLNSDKTQHVYSTAAAAGQAYVGSPAGTYVGFEDEGFPGADANYHDDTFVFTNTTVTAGVPEPTAWALALVGMAGLGLALRSQRRTSAASA